MVRSARIPAVGAECKPHCQAGGSREATITLRVFRPMVSRPFNSNLFTCQCTDWLCVAGAASREAARIQ